MTILMPCKGACDGLLSASVPCPDRDDGATVCTSVAASLPDFMRAVPLIRKAALERWAPIPRNEIGRLLSRMSHGGSEPSPGFLILACVDGSPVGFALSVERSMGGPALAWLHADGPESDTVLDRLWRKVREMEHPSAHPAGGPGERRTRIDTVSAA